MNTCKKCGAPLYSHASVCIKCLTPIPQAQPKSEEPTFQQTVVEQPKLSPTTPTMYLCNSKQHSIQKFALITMILVGILLVAGAVVEIFRTAEFYDVVKKAASYCGFHQSLYESPIAKYENLTIYANLLPALATILGAIFFGYVAHNYRKQNGPTLCGYGAIALSAYFVIKSFKTLSIVVRSYLCKSEHVSSHFPSIGELDTISTQGFSFVAFLVFIAGLAMILFGYKKKRLAVISIATIIGLMLILNIVMMNCLPRDVNYEFTDKYPIASYFTIDIGFLTQYNVAFCKEFYTISSISMFMVYAAYFFAIVAVYCHCRKPRLEPKE